MRPTPCPDRAESRTPRRVSRTSVPRLRLEELEARDVPALVAAYGFDEGTGTSVTDESGHGLTGTVSNATWVTGGRFGGALSFNGTNSWVTVPDSPLLDLTTGMTVEAWVNPTSFPGWSAVAIKESPDDLAYGLYADDFGNDAGGPRVPGVYATQGGATSYTLGTAQVPLNAWTYLAATYDGSALRLYVNGVLASSVALAGPLDTSAGPLRIGGDSVWGEWFSGLIDEVRVYDTALTAAQIQTDMSTPVNGTPDTTPPTVSLTAPAGNATVSGAVIVSATAADNVGVVGVQFLLDGNPLGAEVTSPPYSVTWASTAAANGPHQLTAVARDAAGNRTTSAVLTVTVSNADTTPPTVSLTAPANNAAVSGSVAVSAGASDNVGVAGVQFLLDGAPLGAEVTSSPYSISWDSTTVANGSHVLSAVARDAAGNKATAATRTVNVSNAATDPAVVGQWSDVLTNWPLVAINAVLLDTGKVLMWDGGPTCIGAISATVWDPATNTFTPAPSEPVSEYRDIFCSSQTVLADGRVLVTGGHDCTSTTYIGSAISEIFDPATQTWTDGPDMTYRRWYPTAITLPNGKALVVAGSATSTTDYQPIPEVYDPAANTWTPLSGASETIPNYPFMFQLPDGRVLAAGSDEAKMGTFALDVASQTWTTVDGTILDAGSAVMYAPGKIMKAGSSYLSAPLDNGGDIPSAATTYVLDTTQGSQTWQQTASMAYPRTHLNLTVLPDGTVLATGGSSVIGGIDPATGVLPAELWNPTTETWTTMASEARAREYHSTALLLPDGRVLVAGSGHNYANSYAEYSAEIYSPPYLFKGARPTITSSPGTLAYGSSFFVGTPDGASIASVSLIRNGAVTHSFNTDQQFIPLSFTQAAGGLTVTAPPDADTAPPGYYMLYVVNSNGVPSIAPFVRMSGDSQAPTAPAGLTATRSGASVALNWTASTDDVGVTGYDVYRSTTANFTPSAATQIGRTTGTTYTDPGPGNGTYYYVVAAADAAGNVSAASNQTSITVTATGIVMVQHATTGNESSQAQMSLAFPANVTAGDFLIVTGTAAQPRSTITISDTAGNTFIPAISGVSDSAQDVTASVWYVVNAKGGPDTITLSPDNGPAALEIHISEWSGVNRVNPLDQTSTATGTGTQTTSGTVTTTQAGELVFGYSFTMGNSGAGAGLTALSSVNGDMDEYQVAATAGPVAATFTQSPSGDWFALMATFRPDGGDTQPPTPPGGLKATAAPPATIGLSWSAATDNIGVTGYDVYRSTTSGFTPLPSNKIGSTAGTTYTDTGLPAGTFYYLVVARDAAGNNSPPSNEASASVAGDTTPPTVSLTAPANNATVSGAVTVSAGASDNVGVIGVQFLLDGNPLGAEVTSPPYSISWNSTTVANGSHTLSARARDAAGNVTTSAGVAVTVSNTAVSGLVAAYGFNEGAGTTVGDSSPNGLTGTVSNATWVTGGRFGDALSFNGTNSWVTVPDNPLLDLTTGMTVEAWVKPTSFAGWSAVAIKESPDDLSYGLYADDFGDDAGGPRRPGVYVTQGGVTSYTVGTAQVPLNTWTYLSATYDGSALRLYVNGVLAGSVALAGPLDTNTGPLRIGGDAVWGEWFSGLIDEVRIYNTALTAAQIQADMSTPINGTPDTTPPTVSLTAPANNATVSGAVTVSAGASDNVGVIGVQFLLDGNPLGAEVTSPPYSISWNSTTAANGNHVLSARARDAAGNVTTSAGVAVTVSNTAAVPGLVAAYGFDEGAGTTVTDASGHGLTGTVSNATWVTGGRFGDALSFNGTNSWVTVPDNPLLDLTTGMTVEAWVKPTSFAGWSAVAIKESPDDLSYGLYADDFGNDAGGPRRPGVYVTQGGTTSYTVGTAQVPLNTWTYLSATYDGSALRLYVNGVLAGSVALAGPLDTNTGPLRIGGDAVWGEWFSGLIDEVRIYNTALTAAQIQADMNTPINGTP